MASLRKLSERFTETRADDEIVVMRLDSGDFLSLQGTAAAAWSLIDGTLDRDDLVARLAADYSADRPKVEAELDEFLAELERMGLIAGD
jgi:hypothetical protein